MRDPDAVDSWRPMTIKRLFPETLAEITKVLNKIPQLPISVQKVIEMTMNDAVGARELAEVALTDPVLSSKILTLVNSAYYATNRRIDDMRVAIVLVGFNAVRNIAIQNRFFKVFDSNNTNNLYNRDELWLHSFLVSVCAESFLASRNEVNNKLGVYATLGMLHDIGKYALYAIGGVLRNKNPSETRLAIMNSSMHSLKKEELLFGINHAVVGGLLAKRWNLSERLATVIEYHHHPSFYPQKNIPAHYLEEITAIHAADAIVNTYMGNNMELHLQEHGTVCLFGAKKTIDSLLTAELSAKLAKAETFIDSLHE